MSLKPEWIGERVGSNFYWHCRKGDYVHSIVIAVEKRPKYPGCRQYWRCEIKTSRPLDKEGVVAGRIYSKRKDAIAYAEKIMTCCPYGISFSTNLFATQLIEWPHEE